MIDEDNKTLWCGNLPEQVTEELLYELFLQAGPLEKVRIPKDRDGRQKNFAFITYCHDVSVPYAMNLFRGTSLFHRTLSLQSRARMAPLPPPIRCSSLDQTSSDFLENPNLRQQFADMTANVPQMMQMPPMHPMNPPKDDLVMASLQGVWNQRHHPYRNHDLRNSNDDRRHNRDSYHRHPEQGNPGNSHSRRRDRNNHSSGRYSDRRRHQRRE